MDEQLPVSLVTSQYSRVWFVNQSLSMSTVECPCAIFVFEQIILGPCQIRIDDHHVGLFDLPVGQLDPCRSSMLVQHLGDWC